MSYSKMIELHGPEAEELLQKDSQTLTNNHLLISFTEIVNRIKMSTRLVIKTVKSNPFTRLHIVNSRIN